MLARSAGYDAGYALYSTIASFMANDEFDEITEAINIWEEARLRKIFNENQYNSKFKINFLSFTKNQLGSLRKASNIQIFASSI